MAEGMTGDLVAFLKARLDEDEQVAKAAQDGKSGRWDIDLAEETGIDGWVGELVHDEVYVAHIGRDRFDLGNLLEVDARHIVRWDPARALAEVRAKRRIINGLQSDLAAATGLVPADALGALLGREFRAMAILRWLALPYATHPDYRAEWAPIEEAGRG